MVVPPMPPNFTGFNPNFQMLGGNLPVPYQAPGLPALPGPGLGPQGIPEAVNNIGLDGLGGSAETAAGAAGRQLLMRFLGPAALAGSALAYVDPGNKTSFDQKPFDPFLGINPQDEPNDLGITSIGKSMMRGAADTGNTIDQAIAAPFRYLGSTNEERAAANPPKQGGPVELTGMNEADNGASQDMPEYVIPGAGNKKSTGALDDLMKVMAALKPGNTTIPDKLKNTQNELSLLEAVQARAPSKGGVLAKAAETLTKGSESQQLQQLGLDALNVKNTQEWLKDYAKTGVDVEKVKNDAKDDLKIHTTKNGFLVEMNDNNGNKILKPISGNIFGAQAGQKFGVMGHKFDQTNPLAHELGVLQNLSDVGILNDVLVENSKDLMKATKGITDPKQMQEAQILTIARAMHQNPKFKASLQQKYLDQMGKMPTGQAAPEADWLSQLAPSENE